MPHIERTAHVRWEGNVARGAGSIDATSGAFVQLPFSLPSRIGDPGGKTSPEELLAAAHASCYSMALASGLVGGGWEPLEIQVSCTVGFEVGVGIVSSKLTARVTLDGEIPDDKLRETAERAKLNCPVSKALAGIEITLELPDLPPPEDELGEGAEVGAAAEE